MYVLLFRTAIMCAIYGLDLDSNCINSANAPLIAQTHPTHLSIMRNCLLGHPNLHVATLDAAQNEATGITPLCLASYLGKTEMMTLLLEDGRVNVDGADNKNATPLMYAGEYNLFC
jgi:ankyrin repeat protein